MPPEKTSQNPTPDPTSLPTSPQPAVEGVPEITPIIESPTIPVEGLEALREDLPTESNKEAPPKVDEIKIESGNEPIPKETADLPANPVSNGTKEPLETATAQMGRNEPLNPVRSILKKAQEMIQARKRKKLDKILTLFTTKTKITNDDVEKYLHCSDATATRYLSQLEKEGKIKQTGKKGQNVSYSKI